MAKKDIVVSGASAGGMGALDETIMLLNRLGEAFVRKGDNAAAEQCFNRAREAYERSRPIREAALANQELSADELRVKRA